MQNGSFGRASPSGTALVRSSSAVPSPMGARLAGVQVLATLAQEEEGGGVGELLVWVIVILTIVSLVAFFVAILPVLIAVRHGWRWTLAMMATAFVFSLPLRIAGVLRTDPGTDSLRETWGWVSFPLWVALAVIAWRGPPGWLPWLRRPPSE